MPTGGSAHVTSYGGGKSVCMLTSIRKDATPLKIGVRCTKPNGDPVDSRFSLGYTR